MLNKVLIITHGLFGIELKKSAEMIMGEQENVEALGLIPGQSVDELHAQALEIVKKNEADGFHTVVMVDLMGGSPSNVALMTCLKEVDCDVLVGVNMPMLIAALSGLTFQEDSELAESAFAEGQNGMWLINHAEKKHAQA